MTSQEPCDKCGHPITMYECPQPDGRMVLSGQCWACGYCLNIALRHDVKDDETVEEVRAPAPLPYSRKYQVYVQHLGRHDEEFTTLELDTDDLREAMSYAREHYGIVREGKEVIQ